MAFKNENKTVNDAIAALGLKICTREELEKIIDRIVADNKVQIEKLGKNVFGLIMGSVMKEVRGKATPELVNELVRKKVNQ